MATKTLPLQTALGVLGIIAVMIYGCQLHEMRKATTAATDGVQLARDSAHLDQRAWVAPCMIEGTPEIGKPYDISVKITNTGRTFAREFKAIAAWKRQAISDPTPDFDAELDARAKDLGNEKTSIIGLIPPNGTFSSTLHVSEERNLTKEAMEIIESPAEIMFVFGRITYKDIFGCEHWTTFSARCFANGVYQNIGAYNDADNNRCTPSASPAQ